MAFIAPLVGGEARSPPQYRLQHDTSAAATLILNSGNGEIDLQWDAPKLISSRSHRRRQRVSDDAIADEEACREVLINESQSQQRLATRK
jgi:hypothetical protein